MRSISLLVVPAVALSASAQTGVLDQESPWEGLAPPVQGASFNLSSPSLTWQQQVRAGVDGQLEGIELGLLGPAGAQVSVRIRAGSGWATGSALFEAMVVKATASAETVFVDMTSAGIALTEGDTFVIEAQGNDTGMNFAGSYVPPASGGPAYDELLFLNMSAFADGGWRHGFRSYMLTDVVCYADCDESGGLDFFDFLCFQNAFAAGEPYADCDESGDLDFFDFLCYQNAFAAGCP